MNKKEPDKNITKKQRKAQKEPSKDKVAINRKKLPTHFEKKTKEINTNSWFNITERKATTQHKSIPVKLPTKQKQLYITKSILIHPNDKQKETFDVWFNGYTKMYNETVKYIRTNYQLTRNNITEYKWHTKELSFIKLREKMKEIKKEIIKKNGIFTHVLDTAIKLVATNLQSGITNLARGHMRRIKLNYWKYNRNSKTIEIEPCYIRNDMLCPGKFDELKYTYNNKEYKLKNVKNAVKLNYNETTKRYTLYVPEIVKTEIKKKSNAIISLDPGLRTFMTGVSESKMVEIGNNVNKKICGKLEKYNEIKNNPDISKTIKKKHEKRVNRKISDSIDDLQWKTIKYLTKNYDYILLGDMSAQGIVRKESNVLTATQKVACLRTKYYVFQQRLQFKCEQRGVAYLLVNEYMTSKTCSNCGAIKNDLGANKTYDCEKCNCTLDRDVNGARNIWLKTI